ncbi:MAG: sigma-70 family RNA polymerase sigma factor [Clostridiales Family XIII bacterium]|jgi:RNA polymerase sigma-70 factor (ECF subfamily)|nr:sigma-70 family RNA polymerase sigma factor [Clostridiales Family XIII bacterium]
MESKLLNRTIKEAIRGDREAFAELYRVYAKTIYFHTYNCIWDKGEVEDVAQDVVIRMLKTIGSLRSPYAFTAWMHQVITSVCYESNEAYSRKRSKNDTIDSAGDIVDDDVKNDPAHAAQRIDANELIYSQIQKLPDMQRMAIIMHYYDEMKHREIAKALGVTESTISTNIMKAKKKLKEILEKDKRFGGTEELLGSVAMGPAITESLTSAADKLMPPVKLEHFCDACAIKVQAYLQGAAVAKVAAIGSVKFKFIVGIISAIVVTGSSYLVYETLSVVRSGGGHGASEFVPKAEIVLQIEEGELNATNPVEASLVMGDDEGVPSGYSIVDSSGAVVASGDGEIVTDALQGLSPGEYSIRWSVVKGEAEAIVKRTFFID